MASDCAMEKVANDCIESYLKALEMGPACIRAIEPVVSEKIEPWQKPVSDCSIDAEIPWRKFNMTEDEYNLWKDMDEELKDTLIQRCPEKAEVVRRLRSEAREGKAQGASRASQEHINFETEGGSLTAQNEPPPNHQGLPIGGDHQFHKVQVNGSTNQTDNYAPESADMESGRSSTLADNEPAPDNFGNDTVFMVVGEGLSIALAVISAKKGEGEKTIVAKIFLYVLTVFILVGIISLSYGLCLSRAGGRVRSSIVARLVKTVCYVAVGLAVATGAGLQFPYHVMVWVIPLVWGIIAPAIVGYAINQ